MYKKISNVYHACSFFMNLDLFCIDNACYLSKIMVLLQPFGRLPKNKFYRKLVTIFRDGMCRVIWCAYALNCVFTLFVLYKECTQIKKLIVCSRLIPLCLI